MTWEHITTCSRVSSGVCAKCQGETYHEAFRHESQIRCRDCYEMEFEPDKWVERELARAKAQFDRQAKLKDALEGNLPGAIITENGAVLGPKGFMGMRQVLREATFPREESKPVEPHPTYLSLDFYKPYIKPTDPEKTDDAGK